MYALNRKLFYLIKQMYLNINDANSEISYFVKNVHLWYMWKKLLSIFFLIILFMK